jgi:hypothetical protein
MNAKRLRVLRQNAQLPEYKHALAALESKVEEALRHPCPLEMMSGNWAHYYYCPTDGIRLTFHWDRPQQHNCSVCKTSWTGEPYDGAWVSIAHSKIASELKSVGAMYAISKDTKFLKYITSTLVHYATYYHELHIHGDIPYNGPGKLFSQTLDEAHWIIDLCVAYRFIEDSLTKKEMRIIHEGLLEPCARFLIDHKEKQIHNHAVLITSAICMIGLLTGDEKIHATGRNGQYGLLDQLKRGVLKDGFWYEGAIQYHYYALGPIMEYGLLAEGTQWDIMMFPEVKKMFDFPLSFLLPDGSFPSLNDASTKANFTSYTRFYEVALSRYGDDVYKELLLLAYDEMETHYQLNIRPNKRDSLYALLYGEPLECKKAFSKMYLKELLAQPASSATSGLTKLVNKDGWHLTVKHSPFGGEHDHMDRLGVSFGSKNTPVFVDPGTTSYAVSAHYDWFKHTYSHNTICIDGKDQPPQDAQLLHFSTEYWGTWAESLVNWEREAAYYVKDKVQLPKEMCTWDEEAYKGVTYRRLNVLTDSCLLDIVNVTLPSKRTVELLYHFNGTLDEGKMWNATTTRLSDLKQTLFEDKKQKPFQPLEISTWNAGKKRVLQSSWCSHNATLFHAKTLNNPIHLARRETLVQRVTNSNDVIFINAFSISEKRNHLLALQVESERNDEYVISIVTDESTKHFLWNSGKSGAPSSFSLLVIK